MTLDAPKPSTPIVLVHHAEAVGPDVDPQRPLSRVGRAQAEWLARRAKDAGIKPATILHSGKLRARETAEFLWRACNPLAEFKMSRGLRPDDAAGWIRDLLQDERHDVLVVSHMPLLPALARLLDPAIESFPLHGLIAFERTGGGSFVERYRLQPGENLI